MLLSQERFSKNMNYAHDGHHLDEAMIKTLAWQTSWTVCILFFFPFSVFLWLATCSYTLRYEKLFPVFYVQAALECHRQRLPKWHIVREYIRLF